MTVYLKRLKLDGDRVVLRYRDFPHTFFVSLVVIRVVWTGQLTLLLGYLTATDS